MGDNNFWGVRNDKIRDFIEIHEDDMLSIKEINKINKINDPTNKEIWWIIQKNCTPQQVNAEDIPEFYGDHYSGDFSSGILSFDTPPAGGTASECTTPRKVGGGGKKKKLSKKLKRSKKNKK